MNAAVLLNTIYWEFVAMTQAILSKTNRFLVPRSWMEYFLSVSDCVPDWFKYYATRCDYEYNMSPNKNVFHLNTVYTVCPGHILSSQCTAVDASVYRPRTHKLQFTHL